MNKKRSLMFTLVRGTAAILIALLVATVLIFISAEGATFGAKIAQTGSASARPSAITAPSVSKTSPTYWPP